MTKSHPANESQYSEQESCPNW